MDLLYYRDYEIAFQRWAHDKNVSAIIVFFIRIYPAIMQHNG